jgi:hypothetical protein
MTKQKQKRKLVDWDSIEPLYRAGSLSIHKICDQYEADHINSGVWKTTVHHTAILKKAKQKNWTRNLAEQVKQRVKEKLVTNLVTIGDQKSDNDIVEQAAEVGTQIVLRHRKEIRDLLEHEQSLLQELQESKEDTLKDKTIILKNIAAVRVQRIALERQAYNLGDDKGQNSPIETISDKQLDAKIKAIEAKLCK